MNLRRFLHSLDSKITQSHWQARTPLALELEVFSVPEAPKPSKPA